MIEQIGEWVLRTACHQAKAWLEAGHQLRIAVNVSPIQLRKGRLFDNVVTALRDSGLPPASLALEITESAVMEDVEAGAAMLRRLHELGIQIEIDDFGTGHSSLAYLKQLPIERLKIDQSFVRAVPGDADSEAIVDAIIGLATSLRLEIIAEGVETEAQRRFLLERGCRAMQGFHFHRPQSPDEFEARLRAPPQLPSSSSASEQL
jgi:EAL domain-containing protein (putative c-di-GMP-specific phosphodiesterase class I)